MIILFIIGLMLGAIAVVFALQNVAIVTVSFFNWQLTSSISVIVILSIISGILIALLLFLPESIKSHFRYKKLKKENSKLEEELRKQKEKTVFAKSTPASHEDIVKIEDGVIGDHM